MRCRNVTTVLGATWDDMVHTHVKLLGETLENEEKHKPQIMKGNKR
jgi:hypothetical protein